MYSIAPTNTNKLSNLASYNPLHLLVRRNWRAGQVWVGVADALGSRQMQAAWAGRCPR